MSTLKFNTGIYKRKSVLQTVAAFAHLASFRVKKTKDYTEVAIRNINPQARGVLADEFSNYALGLTKKCH